MKISLDWISDYVDLTGQPGGRELAAQLTLKTVEVEDTVDLAAGLSDVVVGYVTAAAPAGPGSSVVRCDVGAGRIVVVVTRGEPDDRRGGRGRVAGRAGERPRDRAC